jgi:hypothetical protein
MPIITETTDERFAEPEKARALAQHLSVRWTEIEEAGCSDLWGYGDSYEADGGSYTVCNEEEANAAWEAALDSCLDDCVLPEMPDYAVQYFDREAWKDDARMDGREHAINSYDGNEEEITDPVTGEDFLLYRTN